MGKALIIEKYLYYNILKYNMDYKKSLSATVDNKILDKARELSKRRKDRHFSHYIEEALVLLNDKIEIKN